MKPQAGVVYGHGETGLYTNGVRTLGSVWEGRQALVTIGSGKMCVGIKIPFEIHRNVEIAISRVTKEVGNFHGKSSRNDLSRPSVGTRG